MTMEDFDNAFELAGYKSIHAVHALRFGEQRRIQIGLSGGDPDITNNGPRPENPEQAINMLLENKSGASYATMVTPYSLVSGYPQHHITVEVYDFINGMSSTLVVPYTPKRLLKRFTVHQPEITSVDFEGQSVLDDIQHQIFIFAFLSGVRKNPEHTNSWSGCYNGQYLNDEINLKK